MIDSAIIAEITNVDLKVFSQALEGDKKNSSSNLVLVLPLISGLGLVEIPFIENAIEGATRAVKVAIEMVLNEIR